MIIKAIFLSSTSEATECLNKLYQNSDQAIQELIDYLRYEEPPNIEEIEIDNPSILDILWSAFMATGDAKYVIRILSALPDNSSKENPEKEMISNMAKWSLESNIKTHKKVRSICNEQLKYQSRDIALVMQEILK